jgi:hypothetical protein
MHGLPFLAVVAVLVLTSHILASLHIRFNCKRTCSTGELLPFILRTMFEAIHMLAERSHRRLVSYCVTGVCLEDFIAELSGPNTAHSSRFSDHRLEA